LTAEQVEIWLKQIDFATLINRKGTSWRALSEKQKSSADNPADAMKLILENPSLIKRPVLQIDGDKLTHIGVGFNDQQYQIIFKEI
jgi:arsenate reductase